ncbi:MAG: CRISPR-associated endonuclease Cas6 [Candidatus Neomarinimicrobiota bacterium]
MSDSFPDIKSVVVRVITNKPVRKTPYQVKGVFMRQFPDEDIIPMLNGTYRDRYLYPRVQVKILNEQIHLIGINEGFDPVVSLHGKLESLDFGNITFDIEDCDIQSIDNQFTPSEKLLHYRFITPWVALNHMTGGKYKFLTNQEKPSYLNKLLGQNIIFLAREVGITLDQDILTKVKVSSLFPEPVDDDKWGAFMGEFKTNFVLPSYIGIGNGITRGFGTIYGMFSSNTITFDKGNLDEDDMEEIDETEGVDSISASDVPEPKRKRHPKRKKKKFNSKNKHNKPRKNQRKKKKFSDRNQNKQKAYHGHVNRKKPRHGHVISEDYDIEDENGNLKQKGSDQSDDQRFNTEKHHKQQHKF